MAMLGYSYDSEKLKGIRDILKHAKLVHVYKLTSGGEKASNTYATAKYTGVAGNSIKTVIASNVDNTSAYDVSTYMGTTLVDRQTVTSPAELNDNDYVSFKKDASLTKEAGVSMTGGTNAAADTSAHQKICMWLLVGVGVVIDNLLAYTSGAVGITLPFSFLVACIVAVWIICNEIISILENINDIGVTLPPFLMPIVRNLKSQVEDKADILKEGGSNDD